MLERWGEKGTIAVNLAATQLNVLERSKKRETFEGAFNLNLKERNDYLQCYYCEHRLFTKHFILSNGIALKIPKL